MDDRIDSDIVTQSDRGALGDCRSDFEDFDAFFRAEYRKVVGLLMMLGARLEEAKDATQESMAEVARRWGSIDYPRAYVRLVAKRAFYRMDAEDRRQRHPKGGTRVDLDSDIIVNTATLNDWVATLIEMDDIMSAIQGLPAKQREVVAMKVSGFSPQEIAKELGQNPATVRSNLRHGLAAIRATLAHSTENPARTGRES